MVDHHKEKLEVAINFHIKLLDFGRPDLSAHSIYRNDLPTGLKQLSHTKLNKILLFLILSLQLKLSVVYPYGKN